MIYLIFYIALFFISLVYTVKEFEKKELGKHGPLFDHFYLLVSIIMSVVLIGFVVMVVNAFMSMIESIQYRLGKAFLSHIKKKYKINDENGD